MAALAAKRGATVLPAIDFDPEALAQELKDAMTGDGANESKIIKVLTGVSNTQRMQVMQTYADMFETNLQDDIKEELGGDLEQVVIATLAPSRLYDARELRRAIEGGGTDEAVLIEILASRSNQEIEEIKVAYEEEFGRNLEDDIENDTSGDFRHMLLELCHARRAEYQFADMGMADRDAQALYDAGEGQFGTEESMFQRLLCTRPRLQLFATFSRYEAMKGRSIDDAIKSEFGGSLQDGFLAIVKVARDPRQYFAERLYDSMHGLGTDDDTLIRVVVSRMEVDLKYIRRKFREMYEKTLRDFISDDCSGAYKRMLLEMVGDEQEQDDD